MHLYFFLGVDPAPSEGGRSDDGAMVAAAAWPKYGASAGRDPDLLPDNAADWNWGVCRAQRLTFKEKLGVREWSGLIHQWHGAYSFAGIGLDPQGGGTFIERELIKDRQLLNGHERETKPIADVETSAGKIVRADFILHMLRPSNAGVKEVFQGPSQSGNHNDNLYGQGRLDLDNREIMFPPRTLWWLKEAREQMLAWSPEKRSTLKEIDAMREQLMAIEFETDSKGVAVMTRQNSRFWFSRKKKDLVLALLNARVAFRIWLKLGRRWAERNPEDGEGSLVWAGGGRAAPDMGDLVIEEMASLGG
jgi:hypothetical protein